jgi:hypothetical protein
MRFWLVATIGFAAVVVLAAASLSAPRLMMGQHPDLYWTREPTLAGLMVINAVSVTLYFALVTWMDND